MARNGGGLHQCVRFMVVAVNGGQSSVQFAMSKFNLGVVGYLATSGSNNNKFWYFKDVPKSKISRLYPAGDCRPLPFGGSYVELERVAGQSRAHIPIGRAPLDEASKLLCNSKNPRLIAKSLIVSIEIFSEGEKIKYIVDQIREVYYPDPQMMSYVRNWVALSRAVRASNRGTLSHPVRLLDAQGQPYIVTRVTRQLGDHISVCSST